MQALAAMNYSNQVRGSSANPAWRRRSRGHELANLREEIELAGQPARLISFDLPFGVAAKVGISYCRGMPMCIIPAV
jgi:hypothetical protein